MLRYRSGLLISILFVLGILAHNRNLMWMFPVMVAAVFVLVGTMPFCRRHENIWLFVLWAACCMPLNFMLLKVYPLWLDLLYDGIGKGILYHLIQMEWVLILSSVEEIVIGFVGRIIWRKQYAVYILESDKK